MPEDLNHVIITKSKLTDLADTIRQKTGTQGTLTIDQMGDAVESMEPEISGDGEFLVLVIDYDGTVIKGAYLDTNDTFTLPDAPSHDGLVFEDWSCPVIITNNTITVTNQDIIIGPTYHTTSGYVEIDIEAPKNIPVTLSNYSGVVNWGDGTEDSLLTHTYANEGRYMISLKTSFTTLSTLFANGNYLLKGVRLSNSITTISASAFSSAYRLEYAIISNSVTSIGIYAFRNCYALTTFILPKSSTTDFGSSSYLIECYSLKYLVMPNGIRRSVIVDSCNRLESINIPDTVTVIGSIKGYSLKRIILPDNINAIPISGFSSCYGLLSIVLPKNLSLVNKTSFYYCLSCGVFDFSKCTNVPTLDNVSAFTGTDSNAKIIVPDSLYATWIAASKWSDFASQIVKASEA